MQDRFDDFFVHVLDLEGRVCEDVPGDGGGPTKWGITIGDYAESVGKRVPARGTHDFEVMKKALFDSNPSWIKSIYRKNYWDKVRGDDLPSGVDWVVADFGINSGVSRGVKLLQRLCGTSETGLMDDATIAASRVHPSADMINVYCDERIRFLNGIVSSRPSQRKFLNGWLSRVGDVRKRALKDAVETHECITIPKAMSLAEVKQAPEPSATTEAVKSKSVWALITGGGAVAADKVRSTWDALPTITSDVQAQLDPIESLAGLMRANVSAILGTVTLVCIAVAIYRHAHDKKTIRELKGE